jgi:acetate kinase
VGVTRGAPVQAFGIELDSEKNKLMVDGAGGDVSRPSGSVRVLVVPTDEEISIAQQTVEVLDGQQY